MFNQNKNRYRDESAVKKWDQLKQYDEDYQDSEYTRQRRNHNSRLEPRQNQQTNSLSVVQKLKQIKESSSRTYSSLKCHVTDMYRKKKDRNRATGSQVPNGVNHLPNGDEFRGAMDSLGAMGSKIKNSKSLQSLEVATMDNIRSIVDRATNIGENMINKYGSTVELQPRSKYDKFYDDPDSDDEDHFYRR